MPNAINYGHLADGWWDRHSVRAFGGTSKVWTGLCATLSERDFDNPAAGVRWPITRRELAPYYRRAAEILDRDASIVDVETPLVPGVCLSAVLIRCSDPLRSQVSRCIREVLDDSHCARLLGDWVSTPIRRDRRFRR